jgi:hypothetical protein
MQAVWRRSAVAARAQRSRGGAEKRQASGTYLERDIGFEPTTFSLGS